MTKTTERSNRKVEIKYEKDAIFENNFIKKNVFYFHNACTQYKFNFLSSHKSTDSNTKWYENMEKTIKTRKNRNSNLVIFGLTESSSFTLKEKNENDVDLFYELIKEIKKDISLQIEEIRRLKSNKKNLGPAPLWIKLGGTKSQLARNEILKAAKSLKTSTRFKGVSISPDLSVSQRTRLKELNVIRNELNNDLNSSSQLVNFYYGLRNNKIIKIRKDNEKIPNKLAIMDIQTEIEKLNKNYQDLSNFL
jgi:hypothetical protein